MLEIYFSDLNDDAKKRVLDYLGIESSKEANMDVDVIPIAIIGIEDNESE